MKQPDAEALASALADVSRHYKLPALSSEKMALAVLLWTAGRIYVPMGLAFVAEKNMPPGSVKPAAPQADPKPGDAMPPAATSYDWTAGLGGNAPPH